MDSDRPHQIITANALLVLEVQNNPQLKKACDDAALILGESAGVAWAAKILQGIRLERIAGIDFAMRQCERAAALGKAIYLLGGGPGIAELTASSLNKTIPNVQVTGSHCGFFDAEDEPALIEDIRQSRARLVLVAIGMPKQDIWIHQHINVLPPALYIGVGGSFDIWTGKIKRAPRRLQDWGLEWLYRLFQEPKRWTRILQLPRFVFKVLMARLFPHV